MLLEDRLEEIELCLSNDDINNASRRLMDITYDFPYAGDVKYEALSLRKEYNEGKELGRVGSISEEAKARFIALLGKLKELDVEIPTSDERGEMICMVQGISKTFRSHLHNFHFQSIDLECRRGSIIGIVGENGNGKTTLLRMIAGDLSTDQGAITYYFDGIPDTEWLRNKKRIAFIPQRLERWYGRSIDNVSFVAALKGYADPENTDRVNFIIHRLGLTNFRELTWSELSSGYRLRFAIAMVLVWEPSVLILDEPLANLDIQAQEQLLQDLKNLSNSLRNPVCIILSSQQLHEVETVADRVIFLKNGRAVFNGGLDEFGVMEQVRTVEVSGSFDYSDLNSLFSAWEGIKIEKTASAFTVSFSDRHSVSDFIKVLNNNGKEIDYFRNITGSTKKLFNDKY